MPTNKEAVQVKTKEDAEKLIDKYDHFLFDVSPPLHILSSARADYLRYCQCDGVIWTGPAGDKL